MSAVLALANRSRIKPSHRRRRKAASAHLVYILNNPLSGKDPTGYASKPELGTLCGDMAQGAGCAGVSVTQVGSASVSAMKAAAFHEQSRAIMQSIFSNSSGADSMTAHGPNSKPLDGQTANTGGPSGTVNGIATSTDQSTTQATYEKMSQGNILERTDAAFVGAFGKTYAAWKSLLTGQPAQNPVSGQTVEGVDAWNERFLSAATLLPTFRVESSFSQLMRGTVNAGATLPEREIANFIGKPAQITIAENEVLYGIRDAGSRNVWWTRTEPAGELQWRMDQAVPSKWNQGTHIQTLTVPRGQSLIGFEGPSRGQGWYPGGGNQVYIPNVPHAWTATDPWP